MLLRVRAGVLPSVSLLRVAHTTIVHHEALGTRGCPYVCWRRALSALKLLASAAVKRRIVRKNYPCGSRSASRNFVAERIERILPGWSRRCGSRCVPLQVLSASRERRIVWEHYQCGSRFAPRDSPADCFERILSGRGVRCGSRCVPQQVFSTDLERIFVGEHIHCGSSFAPRNNPADCFERILPG